MTEESSKITRVFNWNDSDLGKQEFDEMWALYKQHLRGKQYLLDPACVRLATPRNPGDAPAAAAALREWNKRMDVYQEKMLKLHTDSLAALGILQESFVYGCAAQADLESAIIRPPDVAEANWTPIQQLPAAIAKLRANYMPTSVPDVDTLRRDLQNLSDETAGGFFGYRAEFTQKLSILKKTGIVNAVTDAELKQWVIKGIKNETGFSNVVSSFLLVNENANYEEIFNYISKWLTLNKNNGIDPYKTLTSSPGSTSIAVTAAAVSQRTPTAQSQYPLRGGKKKRCLRCWATSHLKSECRATTCDACRHPLGAQDRTCPKWSSHRNEDCRFWNNVLPRFMEDPINNNSGGKAVNSKNKFSGGTNLGKRDRPGNVNSGAGNANPGGAVTDTKSSWKALKAAFKAAKRARREEGGGAEEST